MAILSDGHNSSQIPRLNQHTWSISVTCFTFILAQPIFNYLSITHSLYINLTPSPTSLINISTTRSTTQALAKFIFIFSLSGKMEIQTVPSLINNSHNEYNQSETTEAASFDEQLTAALLGEDFPYPLPAKNCTTYPDQSHWDFEYDLVDQFITPPSYSSNSSASYDYDNNNNNYDDVNDNTMVSPGVQEPGRQSKKRKEVITEKQAVNGGTRKRKRHPSQVQDHILAERKRREVLGHMFISLSTMIPGLKKIDKTSILGEAIKHMKHLQEKVNVLEKVSAQQKSARSSMVVVKKYQLGVENDDSDDTGNGSSSIVSDNSASDSGGGGGCGSNGDSSNNAMNLNNSIPEIEVKITDETLLLKVYCETQNGVMAKLLKVVENHHLSVTNCSLLPFDKLALDITIVAQIQEGFDMNVKDFVRSIRSVLRPAGI
ncbi:transcription factor bHLH18 isoform X2 [Spinacia oleracea]|uniref:Transcription factor bHLH18 isoform X2 n=1 Tax=Spinacia oleracea TaxID=3562 RepID=A0A9R0IVQ8_SPIOL|nr:transcription factor bHLH18-like isoform X2 [Spinacia oleracea]